MMTMRSPLSALAISISRRCAMPRPCTSCVGERSSRPTRLNSSLARRFKATRSISRSRLRGSDSNSRFLGDAELLEHQQFPGVHHAYAVADRIERRSAGAYGWPASRMVPASGA